MSIKTSPYRRRLLCAAISLALLPLAGNSLAQAAATPEIDEVIVTGSLITRRDAIAESPILTIDQGAILASGYVTIDQYLNTLPQITPNLSSQSNNPSSKYFSFLYHLPTSQFSFFL